MTTYYCGECGESCNYKIEDHGFGRGEFWGVPYNDVCNVAVSDCCGADLFENPSLTVEADISAAQADAYADYMDWKYDEERERRLMGGDDDY